MVFLPGLDCMKYIALYIFEKRVFEFTNAAASVIGPIMAEKNPPALIKTPLILSTFLENTVYIYVLTNYLL